MSESATALIYKEMEDAHSERKFLTPSYIDSISLGILEDVEQAAVISDLVDISDSEAAHYE